MLTFSLATVLDFKFHQNAVGERERASVYVFRLMHSHVGSGGGENVSDNPQAESHILI